MNSYMQAAPPKKLPWAVIFGNTALFIYMVSSIFHVFPSGLPQPSDFVIALAIVVNFLAFIMRVQSRFDPVFLYALGFGGFTFLINIIHFAVLPDLTFLKSSFYYLYNASFFILVISLLRQSPQKTWNVLYMGLLLAIIIELACIKFLPNLRSFRQTGTFANPNQLALWALIASSMLVLLKARARLNIFDILMLLALGYMQTLSLSKAGLISYLLLGMALMVFPALTLRTRFMFLSICMIFTIFGLFEISRIEQFAGSIESVDKAVERLENIGQERDDSLQGRGYSRIMDHPEFLFFGAGEGGYTRFSDFSVGLEMHSGLGTLVFCYGIVGFVLFTGLLYYIARRNDALVVALIAIIFIYGLTHQNIRLADFWLFLAICYAYKEIDFGALGRGIKKAGPNYLPLAGFSKT
jgi:hypothetical protein